MTGMLKPQLMQAMQRASVLLQAGNFVAARSVLEQILREAPRFVEAHRLLAGAQLALGDADGAERSLRRAVAIDADWAPAQTALGELLASRGHFADAELALRRALASARPYPRAALSLAQLLNRAGRAQDALAVTAALASATQADPQLLDEHASALAALGRFDEAIATRQRIVAALPGNAEATLRLAALLDNAGRHRDAERVARRAIDQGAASFDARYLHARTLIATDRIDEAESLLRNLVRERPDFIDAQTNLAQLIWMRSADLGEATAALDASLQSRPDDEALLVLKANLLEASGAAQAAGAVLAERAQHHDAGTALLLAASRIQLRLDAPLAHALAERAVRRAPTDAQPRRALIDALLCVGDAPSALRLAESLLVREPDDQFLIAAQTTAWRILGDARYAAYCDYAQMARAWSLDTPAGWRTLDDYLRDLSVSLGRLHTLRTHPPHQSLRHGTQTAQNLLDVEDAPIRAFLSAIDAPIRRHLQAIGSGRDPLRRRNAGTYRIKGIWSVRLHGTGYHTNHVHPQGWLSSACYIALPKAVLATADASAIDAADRSGWLKFGEPGIPTVPALPPEHFIRPEPGLLALFPSYFWHGTVPFSGDDTRLTIAFDLVPA